LKVFLNTLRVFDLNPVGVPAKWSKWQI